jgi:hypothetical protein
VQVTQLYLALLGDRLGHVADRRRKVRGFLVPHHGSKNIESPIE